MKKFTLLFVILFTFLLSTEKTFAQTGDIIPQIAIKKVEIAEDQFSSGETVKGKFTFWNMSNFDATDVDYKIILAGEYSPGGIPKIEYDTKQINLNTFIQANSEKEVFFEYKIPDNFSKDDVGISIVAYFGPVMLGWGHDKIDVKGSVDSGDKLKNINITQAYLKFKDVERTVGIQEGFVLPVDGSELNLSFKNENNKAIELTPKIELYKFDNLNEKISEKTLPIIKTTTEQEQIYKEKFQFDNLEPGVYIAKFYFTLNEEIFSNVPEIRFMINGDVATILDANVDKYSVEKAEEFVLTINYMGAPMNPLTGEFLGSGKDAKIIYSIKNENGELVAEKEEIISLKESGKIIASLKAKTKADSLYIDAKIINAEDKILSQISRKISGDENGKAEENIINKGFLKNIKYLEIIVLVVLLLILAINIFYFKNKVMILVSLVLILLIGLMFFVRDGNAQLSGTESKWILNYRGLGISKGDTNPLSIDFLSNSNATSSVSCGANNLIGGRCRHEVGAPFVFVNPLVGSVNTNDYKLNSEEQYSITGSSAMLGCMNASLNFNFYLWNKAPNNINTVLYNDSQIFATDNPLLSPILEPGFVKKEFYRLNQTEKHEVSTFSGTFEFSFTAPTKKGVYDKSIYFVSTKSQFADWWNTSVTTEWKNYGRTSGFIKFEVDQCKPGTAPDSVTGECKPCNNGATNPPQCNTCPSNKILRNNICESDWCTNVDEIQAGVPAGKGYMNGLCIDTNILLQGQTGGGTNKNSDLVKKFQTQPGSILVNSGGDCKIDWEVSDITGMTCNIKPSFGSTPATLLDITSLKAGTFIKPIQGSIEYKIECSLGSGNDIYKEFKTAKCNLNPSVQEI
jgi:hypothetical protein